MTLGNVQYAHRLFCLDAECSLRRSRLPGRPAPPQPHVVEAPEGSEFEQTEYACRQTNRQAALKVRTRPDEMSKEGKLERKDNEPGERVYASGPLEEADKRDNREENK